MSIKKKNIKILDSADRMSMKSKHAHTFHVLDIRRREKFDWRKTTKIEHEVKKSEAFFGK